VAIQQVWEESRDYYLDYRSRLIGELLINPVGSLKKKQKQFLYLHKRVGSKIHDLYLGPKDNPALQPLVKGLERRQRLIQELRLTKKALKLLRVKNMSDRDFTAPLQKLLAALADAGLFEAGVELVGSYCFKVYQNYLGVEWFPVHTIDVDFAVPIPYQGPNTDLEVVLRELGFHQEFRNDGTIFYEGNGLIIEFLKPRKGDGKKDQAASPQMPELKIAPIPLPYLHLLLDHKATITIRDIGKVTIPALPAFLLHKLLLATIPSRKKKQEKDYRQMIAVAKRIYGDDKLLAEVKQIIQPMRPATLKKIKKSLDILQEYTVLDAEVVPVVLEMAGLNDAIQGYKV
jgi:hypothetical protein